MDIEIVIKNKVPAIAVNGEVVSYKNGIQAILEYKEWSRDDMAYYLKVSRRTVDGWVLGRAPSKSAIVALSYMLK